MHRNWLLSQLAHYAPEAVLEQAMAQRISEFVRATPGCFERSHLRGHITGSAWIIDRTHKKVLLTHHRKLDRWLQLGGHSDGDANTLNVALREAQEESGLDAVTPINERIFDVDVHLIPARKQEPCHYHYDVRFLFEADSTQSFTVSEESHDLAWIALDQVQRYSDEASIARMVSKSLKHFP